ncbi:hypothetical protein ACW2Q0_14895 [Nocardia sp. R16R-3T]
MKSREVHLVARTTGIDNTVDAFLGLLRGANTGKMLIRLNAEEN